MIQVDHLYISSTNDEYLDRCISSSVHSITPYEKTKIQRDFVDSHVHASDYPDRFAVWMLKLHWPTWGYLGAWYSRYQTNSKLKALIPRRQKIEAAYLQVQSFLRYPIYVHPHQLDRAQRKYCSRYLRVFHCWKYSFWLCYYSLVCPWNCWITNKEYFIPHGLGGESNITRALSCEASTQLSNRGVLVHHVEGNLRFHWKQPRHTSFSFLGIENIWQMIVPLAGTKFDP